MARSFAARRLFDEGRSALKSLSWHVGQYVCPICLRSFSKADFDSGRLTVEHVPPKALGGTALLLTCKACNNWAGHELDAEAKSRKELRQFADGVLGQRKGPLGRATIELHGTPLRIDVRVDPDDTVCLEVLGKQNDPRLVERFRSEMRRLIEEGRTDGQELRLTSRGRFHQRRSQISDLRSAFLAATAAFGYRYAAHPVVQAIREQVLRPDAKVVEGWWFAGTLGLSARTIAVSVEKGVVIVALDDCSAILPWPLKDFQNYVAALKEFRVGTVSFRAKVVGWPTAYHAMLDHKAG